MSHPETFNRWGRNRQLAVGVVGDKLRGWGTDREGDIHGGPRAVASWRLQGLRRMLRKPRGTWDRARKGRLGHLLPLSLVLDAGGSPEASCAGGGGEKPGHAPMGSVSLNP